MSDREPFGLTNVFWVMCPSCESVAYGEGKETTEITCPACGETIKVCEARR